MAYEWTQLGIREITNLYLYGQPGTPADVADASRIRAPGKGIAVDVNMPSFMSTGPGRFNKRGQAQFHPFSFSALTPPPNRSCIDAGPTVTVPFGRPRGLASRRSPSAKAISA